VIVQSAAARNGPVSLAGVTTGNLILAMSGADSSLNTGNVSLSGFPATFSVNGAVNNPTSVVRAGLATATTVSFEYIRTDDVNILVEISGADIGGMAAAQQSHDVFQTEVEVDGPSLAGFSAGDLVVGLGVSYRDFPSNNFDPGVSLIREEGENDTRVQAVWKVAAAGTNDFPNIFGGNTSEDWTAYTIRIPAA
jgi:hypothetical protein